MPATELSGRHQSRLDPRRLKLRGATVAVGLALMVLVPITALDDPRPSQFGWHMYAANVHAPKIKVTLDSGATEEHALDDYAAKVRPEPDYTEAAAEFICTKDADVKSVRFTRDSPALDQEFSCASF